MINEYDYSKLAFAKLSAIDSRINNALEANNQQLDYQVMPFSVPAFTVGTTDIVKQFFFDGTCDNIANLNLQIAFADWTLSKASLKIKLNDVVIDYNDIAFLSNNLNLKLIGKMQNQNCLELIFRCQGTVRVTDLQLEISGNIQSFFTSANLSATNANNNIYLGYNYKGKGYFSMLSNDGLEVVNILSCSDVKKVVVCPQADNYLTICWLKNDNTMRVMFYSTEFKEVMVSFNINITCRDIGLAGGGDSATAFAIINNKVVEIIISQDCSYNISHTGIEAKCVTAGECLGQKYLITTDFNNNNRLYVVE